MDRDFDLGAAPLPGGGARFRVWAPLAGRVAVLPAGHGPARPIPLRRAASGYFAGIAASLGKGDRYFYLLDGKDRWPDPASRSQPLGVFGPSEIVHPGAFVWSDEAWTGLPMERLIIYEVHIGTFTPEGTFRAAVPRLKALKDLGVTAVELMPLAQFPGDRNWGYDGVFPFAPQNSYGGPSGLKAFVEACHRNGLAVIVDVVYNHLGLEGNVLARFGPYFSDVCRTPWGPSINLDGPWSDEVRRFFVANALAWVRDYHVDGLRMDAIHSISDSSATPFLRELAAAVHDLGAGLGRTVLVIGESDLNDARVISPPGTGGFGFDGLWNDDFHHALHTLLTGERAGFYQDYGRMEHLVKALREGFVYSGQYSRVRRRRRGNSSAARPAGQFVVFSQNHDQVGNRPAGDRLSATQTLDKVKLAAGLVLLSPNIPLLFMGEEYGEMAPFLYFVSFADERLAAAVADGRRADLGPAAADGRFADPRDKMTFLISKLRWEARTKPGSKALLSFYGDLIRLRKGLPPLAVLLKENMEVRRMGSKGLSVRRWLGSDEVLALFNLGPRRLKPDGVRSRGWRKVLDSSGRSRTAGNTDPRVVLRPWSFAVYRRADR
jgi:maltooligosyltrehalose trehalohydrolase